MAVRQRIFNSTSPFSGSTRVESKGSYPSCSADQDTEEEEEEGQDSKLGYIPCLGPLINKVLTRGTAEQVGEKPLKTSTFIAQAECETQDSQVISPSCFKSYVASPNCFTSSLSAEHNNVACPSPASVQEPGVWPAEVSLRKKAKRRQKRKGRKKVEKKKEKQRQRHRTPSGVPEQESGCSLVQILVEPFPAGGSDLSASRCGGAGGSEEQVGGPPFYHRHVYASGSSCSPLSWDRVYSPASPVHSYGLDSDSDQLSGAGDCSLALAGLRGCVSQSDPCYAGPFFKDVKRDEREEEGELPGSGPVVNEGIIFYNEKIQPVDSEYKEGREYVLSEFIKDGSYGEVHSARDLNTGFTFAVKKIAMRRFNSEEVGAWSALRSPRVAELFGAVREGPYVLLFMELKAGSLGQLLALRGRLPEDLGLHYQLQVLTALEYLAKKRVAHLDVKADNVLLSEDGRDTFLCDFGHAERLDNAGQSLSGSREPRGSETHMAPEIVKGEPRGAKADVWSSCCMFLHMLSGCQPWTRYYSCRLYLKIANDPPPLREIPPDCSHLTFEVLKAGLEKDPAKRPSASDLKEKTARALKGVGGLSSAVEGPFVQPLYVPDRPPDSVPPNKSCCGDEKECKYSTVTTAKETTKPGDVNQEKAEWKRCPTVHPITLMSEPDRQKNTLGGVPELELHKLERDFYLNSLSQLHSPEMQEQLLSCLSSELYSTWEPWDKKDSGRWSLNPAEDFSSGVFSGSSQPDVQVFSVDLLNQAQQPPPPCCFEGVDVRIKDFSRKSIRIREARRVKVGHIATGISDQISERVFTLESPQGQHVAHDEEVPESGLELLCVAAPDYSPAWRWRIRDGLLETR